MLYKHWYLSTKLHDIRSQITAVLISKLLAFVHQTARHMIAEHCSSDIQTTDICPPNCTAYDRRTLQFWNPNHWHLSTKLHDIRSQNTAVLLSKPLAFVHQTARLTIAEDCSSDIQTLFTQYLLLLVNSY